MRRTNLKLYGIALLVALLVIVVLQNTTSAKVALLFFSVRMPIALLLVLMVLVGFVLGLIAAGRMNRRSRKRREAKKG